MFHLEHAECPNEVTETCSTWNMLKVPGSVGGQGVRAEARLCGAER
jgi:hypothetical protein